MALSALHFPDFFTHLKRRLPDRFVRKPRKISPAQLIGVLCLMTGFGRKGYRRAIAELQGGLGKAFGWPALALLPSPQAIGQARRSLSRTVCDEAFAAVYDSCHAIAERPVAAYAGLRLVAIDGTRLSLPPTASLISAFGCPSNQRGVAAAPMAGLVQLWDVGRNCPVAFGLTPCDGSERGEGRELLQHLGKGDLLIGDRGFFGYAFFRDIYRRKARFLMRVPLWEGTVAAAFAASGADEAVVSIVPSRRVAGAPPIPLRLLRIVLPNGTVEVLATNLWQYRGHDRATLGQLYTQRWRIETAFRDMKVFHALEQFSATYPDGIYQEIAAIQIFLLLTSELEAIARRDAEQRSPQRPTPPHPPTEAPTLHITDLRFNRLLIADNVIHLLRYAALGGRTAVREAMPDILDYLWKNRSYARPGRSFPRLRKRPLGHYKKSGA